MELPRGLQEMIDEYVADALDSTGTRNPPRRAARIPTPVPLPVAAAAAEPIEVDIDVSDIAASEEPSEALLPIEVDDRTDPDARNIFSFDEGTAYLAPAFVAPPEAIPSLSRARSPRGSLPPPAELEIDEEITNVISTAPTKPQ